MAAIKLVVAILAAVLILCHFSSLPAHAQAPALGTVNSVALYKNTGICPTSGDFYSGPTETMTCYSAYIDCGTQVSQDAIVFGYAPPVLGKGNNGTIVLLSGDGGTSASTNPENAYADAYVNAGYGVVEVAYGLEWHNAGADPLHNTIVNNVINAACRPATFLSFVRYGTLPGGSHLYSSGGMCAQGISNGSSQIAYSLVYYNAGSYLDKAEMETGPPFGNIKEGCANPTPTPQPICDSTSQSNCQGWKPGGITPTHVDYTGGPGKQDLSIITGTGFDQTNNVSTCTDPFTTQSTWESKWDAQSIVPFTSPTGSYNFPNTAIQAWLCQSTNIGLGGEDTLNNSGILGNYFFSKLAQTPTDLHLLTVTAVDTCNMAEGVDSGTISSLYPVGSILRSYYATQNAMTSIEQDMASINAASQTKVCANYHQ